MSDYGIFESAIVADDASAQMAKQASRKLDAAIYDVHQSYGRFLLGSSGLDEFEDRWHYSKKDIRKTVETHLLPVTGVMRRVHDALKREYKEAVLYKGAPFAGYTDFDDCVKKNAGKDDPQAYCGSIKHKVEDKESSRRTADKTGPEQNIQETDYHSDADLVPEQGRGAFDSYLNRVDQGGPEKVESADFGSRDGEDNWENTREGSVVLDLYQDWARSNGLRVASKNTLLLYSSNCTDDEYRLIGAAIQRTAEEDDDDDKDDDDDSDDEDEGDDSGDEDKGDDDEDDDDKPPWLKDSMRRTAEPSPEDKDRNTNRQYEHATGWGDVGETGANNWNYFLENTFPGKMINDVAGGDITPGFDVGNSKGWNPFPNEPGMGDTGGGGGTTGDPMHGNGPGANGEPAPGPGKALPTGPAGQEKNTADTGKYDPKSGDWKENENQSYINSDTYVMKPGDTATNVLNRAYGPDGFESHKDQFMKDNNVSDINLVNSGKEYKLDGASKVDSSTGKPGSTPGALLQPGAELASGQTGQATNEPVPGGGGGTTGQPTKTTQGGDTTITTPSNAAANRAPLDSAASGAAPSMGTGSTGLPEGVHETSRRPNRMTLGSYFRDYYGTQRLAAEDDEESGGGDDSGGGGGAPPAPDPASQDPSAAPPAPGAGAAPAPPTSDQPPVDPSQAPAQLENQPAEDHLLDTASQAVSQMIDRETQEYQQLMDPLQQAMQAIEFAQQVEQQSNPLDVTPPQGTVDVGPQDAATGAPQEAMPAMGGAAAQGAAPQMPPPQLQQQAFRIAKHFNMTRDGYGMLLTALGRKHYQTVADAISGLPNDRDRLQIAKALADNLFAPDNPRFKHGPFFQAAGVDPRLARTAGVPWNQTKVAPMAEHERYDLDPSNWQGDDEQSHWEQDPGYREHMGLGGDEPGVTMLRDHGYGEEGDLGSFEEDPYSGDPMEDIAQGRMYQKHMQNPLNMMHGSRSRLGFSRGRQADAGTLTPMHTLDAFEFPGGAHKAHDPLSVTPDEITDLTPTKKARRVRAKGDSSASGLYDKVKTERGGKGLPTDPSDTIDDFKEMAQMKGLSDNAVNRVTQKEMPSLSPVSEKATSVGGGGGKSKKGSYGSPFGGSFFTRRVPGWEWDDHLAAYKTKTAAPFSCRCGSQFDVPSYYNCRCGAVWNSYPIGSGGDDEGRTASIDMYLCREVAVREEGRLASKEACDYNNAGLSEPHETEWVEEEDYENTDPPHAPYKNASLDLRDHEQERAFLAAIGEDDHHVVYRDGQRFCSACDSLLWDPNVHHCPAKQAARLMFGLESPEDRDDEPTKADENDENKSHTETGEMRHKVKEHEGTSGDDVEKHIGGGGSSEEKRKSQASRTMFGDWTVYDDDDPGHGPGRAEAPDTHVSRPPDDWARRGRPTGRPSLWREPIFPTSRG